jgi:chromosome segregation ATPase
MDLATEPTPLDSDVSAGEAFVFAPPPAAIDTLEQVLGEIRRASTLIEGAFVGIGDRLENSIGSLDRLTATFQSLQRDLGSPEMVEATRSLSQVSRRIADLASEPNASSEVLARITGLTRDTAQRVTRMRKAVKAVDVLAVNAKIAAAHLSAGGEGFASFADEIARAMQTAEENLDRFAGELARMSANIDQAAASQRELHARQDQAIRVIPDQLARSVSVIADRRSQAETTADQIQQKSLRIGQQVGGAVMGMQIGDTTRQRIEHAELALDLVCGMLGHHGRRGSSPDFDAATMPEDAKARLFDGICALQAAQLVDTAREFDGQVGAIVDSLGALAVDARDIAQLGQETFASGGARPGSFLSELEQDVAQAGELLESLRTAQAEGEQVMSAVLETTRSLVGNISAIQSLEADIRLMGLNTTLRSSRLGNEGRALTVIAQELRGCSNLTAQEAEAVMVDLDAMVAAAGATRADAAPQDRLQAVTEVAQVMNASVAALSTLAQVLADALDLLSRESETVVAALERTAAEIKVNAEIGAILRRAAAALDALPDRRVPAKDADTEHPLLTAVAASYTMAREREIHARILGGALPAVEAAPASGGTDDIFF